MAELTPEQLETLPDEMRIFTIQKAIESSGPRLGRLSLAGRKVLETPNYLGNASRGVIPHLSPDNFRRHTNVSGVYLSLEDFIEKIPRDVPPIYNQDAAPNESALKRFICLPEDNIAVLGARRYTPVVGSAHNTDTSISICASVGFRSLPVQDYITATLKLCPDIAICLADVVYDHNPSRRRMEKVSDRTFSWVTKMIEQLNRPEVQESRPTLFAPIPPVPIGRQWAYIDKLSEELKDEISGLAIYDAEAIGNLPEPLTLLPRLSMSPLTSPNQLLQQIASGYDVFIVPFINLASDAGIALTFQFPPPATTSVDTRSSPVELGLNLWDKVYEADVSAVMEGCSCHCCTSHHRAFLQHLLNAREMLAWVLLQMHNHHVMDNFFARVRKSIADGTFEEDRLAFERYYVPDLPEQTGLGPRIRGYQFKSGEGDPKANPAPFTMLDAQREGLAESATPGDVPDSELIEHGFAEKTDKAS
ncbi:tRNA-guanine transglycosylase [Eremomyces bilateralis CBS 781.70]|uniref:Queuine tRNA-ribosyltransferase accessory subunit 2 n=1 Tax=Eremomyces bilateralis CBS 781.70 TaxID=1392243 RepID=A0A6G1G7N1_9PEZI|nr:tRNA-guanine transglycosylase [Eremomyces bilateralis CBS 781.70]KAF1814053.1 tRNA-guanine transglycosylase [Eremomyces bilateralis CBS 781.70]